MDKKKLFRDCRETSLELFESQKRLRILSALNLPAELGDEFLNGGDLAGAALKIYAERQARSTSRSKITELIKLRTKVHRRFGTQSDLGEIFDGRIHDYLEVARLLEHTGKPEIFEISVGLWGSSKDQLFSDGTTVADYARKLQGLIKILSGGLEHQARRVIPAEAVAELMRAHFRQVHLAEMISVTVTDRIIANACAGNGKIKLRKGAKFSAKDVQVLIYHEAYTHVATATNGHAQPYAKFLGFDTPVARARRRDLRSLWKFSLTALTPRGSYA